MELVTAVALFAVFSSVIIVALNPLAQYEKARDSKRKNDLAQLSRAIELYYGDHGRYPAGTGQPSFMMIDDATGQPIVWGNAWQPYIDVVPKDPSSNKRYIYQVSEDRQAYWIFASLDRAGGDANSCTPSTVDACDYAQTAFCTADGSQDPGKYCDYGVSSPNVLLEVPD